MNIKFYRNNATDGHGTYWPVTAYIIDRHRHVSVSQEPSLNRLLSAAITYFIIP